MAIDPTRRDFVALVGSMAIAWPLAARGEGAALPVVGILNSISIGPIVDRMDAFLEGLEDARFVDGKNVRIEYRSADGHSELLGPLAAELLRHDPKVIVCLTSANAVRAAMDATLTVPIVFAISGDPIALGLVPSLDKPGLNVTGAARVTEALNPQRLKVLAELAEPSRPLAFLFNSDHMSTETANGRIDEMEAAASAASRHLVVIDLAGRPELSAIFARMVEQHVAGFVISTEALFNVWRDEVIGFSTSNRIAAMFPNREYVQAGGLVSYGADLYEHYRIAGTYAGRILKGEKPADMPVQLPTKAEMAINLKTARTLGLTVPPALLKQATDVVE
jgi:putative ABC transport system substrate-binding protein